MRIGDVRVNTLQLGAQPFSYRCSKFASGSKTPAGNVAKELLFKFLQDRQPAIQHANVLRESKKKHRQQQAPFAAGQSIPHVARHLTACWGWLPSHQRRLQQWLSALGCPSPGSCRHPPVPSMRHMTSTRCRLLCSQSATPPQGGALRGEKQRVGPRVAKHAGASSCFRTWCSWWSVW